MHRRGVNVYFKFTFIRITVWSGGKKIEGLVFMDGLILVFNCFQGSLIWDYLEKNGFYIPLKNSQKIPDIPMEK